MPRFSIVTPTFNTPAAALKSCISSVLNQQFQDWEWCIVDDASTEPHVCRMLTKAARRDKRIRISRRSQNGGIVAASQDAVDMALGEFVVLLDHDDLLHSEALLAVDQRLKSDPTIDYLYTDEDKIDNNGNHYDVFKKPSFDPLRLAGQNYCCHLSVFRSTLLDQIGGFRAGFEGSQDYDLILRATEKARTVAHIPRVLYHWRAIPGSAATQLDAKPYALEAALRAVSAHLERTGSASEVAQLPSGYVAVKQKA